ncbi:hypothetical protein [Sediminitomix flava]|uniref:Outer membrane protein with beta-barrel domain n=1 Tax=Sediminitomix flava TaxID=379075 RepID=A0A315ZHK6_SEDFL|nr:hypothetical protein [Sediminitomix flava]PWJ45001.1 hypothetical protein BC781_1011399 [Sediminitomix flava]
MKYLFFILQFLTVFVISLQTNAQIGLKTSFVKPSNDFANAYKPSISYEVILTNDTKKTFLQKGVHSSFIVGYQSFNTTQDTLWTFGVINDHIISSGFQMMGDYKSFYLGMILDYQFFESVISPIIGFEAYGFYNSYSSFSDFEGSTTTLSNINEKAIGLSPRIGVKAILLNQLDLTISLSKPIFLTEDQYISSYWKNSISLIYYFD